MLFSELLFYVSLPSISVIKETLENRGVLGQIKARIRAEVFNSLDDHADSRPPLSNENMIINELIREYLEFNKYKYSASVLVAGRLSLASKYGKYHNNPKYWDILYTYHTSP